MAAKITVYTINDCQFSKAEKEYLTSNNLPYEEKNMETNREFLTEMLAVSNNFAGTPVSRIEKDDGTIVILKGFTKEEFDKTLGLIAQSQPTPPQAPTIPSEPAPPKLTVEILPLEIPQAPPVPPIAPPLPTEVPLSGTKAGTNDQLNSILNDLQQKAGA